jgi:thioesterase domain-containing protein
VGYAQGVMTGKLESLRLRLERLRLRVQDKVSQDAPVVKSVDGFVAANVEAIQNYTPRPYGGRMMIVRALGSHFDSERAIETGLGWQEVALGGFDMVDAEGEHLSILEEPGVRAVAAAFAKALARDG